MVLSQVSIFSLPTLLIYALPVLIAASGAGLAWAVAGCAFVFALRTVLGFVAFQATPKGYTLETIAISPFAEVVRWSLQLLGEPFLEVENVGIVGVLLFARTVPGLHVQRLKTSIYNSQDILRYLYGRHFGQERADFLQPVTGEDDLALEKLLTTLPSITRKWAYYHLFNGGDVSLIFKTWGVYQSTTPMWQKLLMRTCYPVARSFVISRLDVNEDSKNRALARLRSDFDIVDKRLADGRKYLLGDKLSYLDLMWAAAVGILIFPEEYSGGRIEPQSMLRRADFPKAAVHELDEFMKRPGGQFCLRLYKERCVTTDKC